MTNTSLLLALALVSTPAITQELRIPDVEIPTLPATGETLAAFVPPGWAVESRIEGRIDADARPDAVLLLRAGHAGNVLQNDGLGVPELDTNPRVLVVLLANGGGYSRLVQDARLIPRNENPVMSGPLEEGGIALHGRVLKVTLGSFASAGSWSMGSTTSRSATRTAACG